MMILQIFILISICFFTSFIFSKKLMLHAIQIVMLYPNIFIECIAVKIYKPANSVIASISEFLRIIPCRFKPFSIPNIVSEVKIIGADNEENRI